MELTRKLVSFDNLEATIGDYYANGGLSRGLATGWNKLDDELYRLSQGVMHVVTGIPSSGKSEWLDQLMLNSIALHQWHWTVFSPENWPLPHHFQKLAEKWTGKAMFRYSLKGDGISHAEIKQTISELSPFITFLEPAESELHLDAIMDLAKQSKDENDTSAFLLDPWNELEHLRPKGMQETEYIGLALTKLRNFARMNNVSIFIVAHPTKLQKDKDGKNYPVPTPYDISGSANWRNKADVCFAVWRDYNDDSNRVELYVQKVRNKNLGKLGMVELFWQRETGLFFQSLAESEAKGNHGIRNKMRQ